MGLDYNVYQAFDLKLHNKTFINYCEVIIDSKGIIRYATPSHQTMLIAMYGVHKGVLPSDYLNPENVFRRNQPLYEVWNLIPDANWWDIESYLLKELKAVSVYFDAYVGTPNRIQMRQLKRLHYSGACKFPNM